MYGFRDKNVAKDLLGFSVDRHLLKPTNKIKKRRLEEEGTRIVRVGTASQSWSSSSNVIAGIPQGDDYLSSSEVGDFSSSEYHGKYLMDYFYCYELIFASEDDAATTPDGDNDHLKTSITISTEYGVTNPSNHETSGTLADRAKFIAHNCSVVPLCSGMIIQVSNIGGHWIYNGTHRIMAEVGEDEILTEEWGDVTPESYGISESGGSTDFDFDAASLSSGAGKTIKAYNPWSDTIPSNSKCILGDVGGRLTIMGWEC